MTPQEELNLWKKVYQRLLEVPPIMRSQNHTNYMIEVRMRCDEIQELINHI